LSARDAAGQIDNLADEEDLFTIEEIIEREMDDLA
jgi:hypothetical protein|tara:strand:+ start:418 stop:522 length:105 start_codon:yes stop_codon:yes gene_type:complete